MRYHYLLSEDALAVFSSCTGRQRQRLTNSFLRIAEFPSDSDRSWNQSGFPFEVKRFGSWDVVYWVDGPVKRIHILRLEKTSP